MLELYAQGDLLIERVTDLSPSGTAIHPLSDGATVLLEGELTGHRHAIYDRVAMFRDEQLAQDVPTGLYVGHVKVEGLTALVRHDEHTTLALPPGTYRVRRQRELEPQDVSLIAD